MASNHFTAVFIMNNSYIIGFLKLFDHMFILVVFILTIQRFWLENLNWVTKGTLERLNEIPT